MNEVKVIKATESTSKLEFAKAMVNRMFAGDKDVFKDCCTEDYRHRTPEFHMINPVEKQGWMVNLQLKPCRVISGQMETDGKMFK